MAKAEKLSQDDVLHLAKLARLELSTAEVEHYAHQLGDVLGYVAKLQNLKPSQVTSGAVEPVMLRPDEVKPWPKPQNLIKQAAENHDNLIEVPAVFGDRE